MSDLIYKSITEAKTALKNKEMSATELTKACLSRIDATEEKLCAFLSVYPDEALKRAQELDAQGYDANKPLWGIPVSVKDALATKHMRTTSASKIIGNFTPPYSAFVVEQLENAGAIILGKNNMDEFAMGSTCENSAFKSCQNPWDLDRVPGGSSGGSAVSVCACQCFASLGSDTGGSIRQPAALCGLVGLKPTYGRVSRYGLLAYASSLDQVGPFARTVEDCALMLSVISGHDKRDSTSAPLEPENFHMQDWKQNLKGITLGIPKEFFDYNAKANENSHMDLEVAKICQTAIEEAQKLGANIKTVSMPHLPYSIAAYYIIASAEASSNLARYDGVRYGHRTENPKDLEELYIKSRTEGFGEEVQRRILLGTYVLSAGYYDAYYKKAAQVRRLIRQDYENVLKECDALLAPVSPIVAWKKGSVTDPLQMYQMDIFTLSLNLAGLPGLSIPVGMVQNMPVGMQIMGSAFSEAKILNIGQSLTKHLKTDFQQIPNI